MIRFLRVVLFILIAAILLGFAFANHHEVVVSFDPFASRDNAALAVTAPLFAVVIVVAMLGALATWLSQGRYRRASRQSRMEADKWRAQAEALKTARARETAHPALPGGR